MPPNLSSRKYSNHLKRLTLLIFLTLVFFILLLSFDYLFSIKEIKLTGVEKNEIILGLNLYQNKNLLLLSTKDIETKIKDSNPMIRSVTVTKIFPHTLSLDIEEYKPAAVIGRDFAYFYLSFDGRILFKSKVLNTPSVPIHYYQNFDYYSYNAGDWLTNIDLITGLHFLKTAYDLGLPVESIDISGFNMIVFNLEDKKIIFTTEKQKELQDYDLEQIVRQFKVEGREYKSIDLRFDKPIIKF